MKLRTLLDKNLFHLVLLSSLTAFTPGIAEDDQSLKLSESEYSVATSHVLPESFYECKRRFTETFKRFGSSVTINITMTISVFSPAAPVGASLDITPFAIGPDGKLFQGEVTNIVPSSLFFQALNPVKINRPVRGNYVVGYFIRLGPGSPLFPNALGNFGGVIINDVVGNQNQTVSFPGQALFVNALTTAADVLTVTGNFPIVK